MLEGEEAEVSEVDGFWVVPYGDDAALFFGRIVQGRLVQEGQWHCTGHTGHWSLHGFPHVTGKMVGDIGSVGVVG